MNKETFCSLPFTEIFLGPDGNVKTCCSARSSCGNLNSYPIEEILQSHVSKQIRQSIIDGQWHESCGQCKQQEDQGVNSERYNNIESFVIEYNDIDNTFFKLSRLDLRWSNTCNLSCTYCYEYFSSKWANIKGITVNTLKDKNEQDFLLFIEKNKDLISNVQLLGGEPLLQKQNSKLIEILSNKNFYILSNLAVPLDKNLIAKSLIKQPLIQWGVSFETVGDRYEYVRHGASWEVFKENLNYLKSNIPDFKINSHSLYSIYSAFNLVEFYEFIIEQDVFENVFWNLLESSGENSDASVINLDIHLKAIAILEIEKCERLFPDAPGIQELSNIKNLLKSTKDNKNNNFIKEISSLEEKLQKSFGKRFSNLWSTVWEKLKC
jgi:MoaA/NifB/PqqE/SkfB family radical SAM enzyme